MNLLTTLKGSLLESFFPSAWDLAQWDACVADDPNAIFDRQPKWHQDFSIRMAGDLADFDVMLGHELAREIRRCREAGRKLALILPVGPMGMYRWTVYFLRDWNIPCRHVYGFNMESGATARATPFPVTIQVLSRTPWRPPSTPLPCAMRRSDPDTRGAGVWWQKSAAPPVW